MTKNSFNRSANLGPIPFNCWISWDVAFLNFSIEPKCESKTIFRASPRPLKSSNMDSLILLLLKISVILIGKAVCLVSHLLQYTQPQSLGGPKPVHHDHQGKQYFPPFLPSRLRGVDQFPSYQMP